MKPIDLSGLIKGLLVLIGFAVAIGKYDQLAAWARREAFASPKAERTLRVTRERPKETQAIVHQKAGSH